VGGVSQLPAVAHVALVSPSQLTVVAAWV